MTKIKICGITRLEDAQFCAELGVDYLGFVFVKESPRYVEPEDVRDYREGHGPSPGLRPPSPRSRGEGQQGVRLAKAVIDCPSPRDERGEGGRRPDEGPWQERDPRNSRPLFVGVFRDAPLDEVRRVASIAHLDLVQLHGSEDEEYVRAIELPVIKALNPSHGIRETAAEYLMFDSGGGTGRPFDWSLLAQYQRAKPFFLAGGLTPDNVADAIRVTRPDAVDVSSGVESAPGIKDHQKIRDFIQKVRQP